MTNDASSEARNATTAATSSGRPIRPIGCSATSPLGRGWVVVAVEVDAHLLGLDEAWRHAVHAHAVLRVVERHLPGQGVHRALRRAVGRVRREADRRRDRADVHHDPPPAATMCGMAWRAQVKMPQRFVSSTRSYSSRSVSVIDLSSPTPALLQRMSTRP